MNLAFADYGVSEYHLIKDLLQSSSSRRVCAAIFTYVNASKQALLALFASTTQCQFSPALHKSLWVCSLAETQELNLLSLQGRSSSQLVLLWTCSLCTTRRNWRVSVRPGTLGISCLSHWVRGCTWKIWKHSRCLPVSASVSCLEHNWIWSALTPDTALLYPDSVNEYFGNPLAYYFSFLDFYTWSLLPPAVLGLVITYFSSRC